jgi:hypothetical protein
MHLQAFFKGFSGAGAIPRVTVFPAAPGMLRRKDAVCKTVTVCLICFFVFAGCRTGPTEKAAPEAKPDVHKGDVTEDTNIHYTGRYCSECHFQEPIEGGDPYLKYNGDYSQLCRCHHGLSPGYCHPLDLELPPEDEHMEIPTDFPVREGTFTCNTCHDIYRQCRERHFNRWMLRGAPYTHKTDFCYRCHVKAPYKQLNAHDQTRDNGLLDRKMCLYCHEKKPDEETDTYEDVNFIGDMKALCRRCHQIAGNHAGDFDHMAEKPSAEMVAHMKDMEEEFNIILPLADDGRMTCITCHNPHEKGVIPADKPSASGAGSKYRHRLPGRLCQECHEM